MEKSKNTDTLQNEFIKNLCNKKEIVHIFLTNGIKLEGYISNSDDYTILLEGKARQLVYKRAISTIMLASTAPPTNVRSSTKLSKITEAD